MKRFIIILLAVCLLLGCLVGYVIGKDRAAGQGEPVTLTDPENIAAAGTDAEPIGIRTLDYEALSALHDPDEIVGSVDGSDVRWEEYFYWLREIGADAEDYIQMLAYYGQSLDWTDKLSADSEETLAEYVVSLAQDSSVQLHVIEAIAEECGATVTEENERELAEQLQQTMESAGCASVEEFNAMLEEEFVSPAMYERLNRANYLYQNIFVELYGDFGEKLSEEDALAYLRDKNYLGAAHILFATLDTDSNEPLDEATVEQKRQQAEAVSAELRAIEDPAERAARFAELKAEFCEDSGSELYPDGYLFPADSGAMVTEFENGVKALQENEVSEPILSSFGYHVILRLPLSADMTVQYSEAGTPLNAHALLANDLFDAMMEERMNAGSFTLREGCEIDLTEFLK